MVKILELSLGDEDRGRLKLRVRGRELPGSRDSDDSNWLQGAVEVRSGRMAGSITSSLRTEDLGEFRNGLAQMTDAQAATAECKTMEDLLAIRVSRVGPGRLEVSGHIDEKIHGNRLSFRFAVDAAGIPMMLKDLDEILDEYPST